MKKTFAILLSIVLMLSLTVPAMATDTYTITINNTATGHTYEAYQIFTGDLCEGVLSNIKWGANISDAGKTALQGNYGAEDAAGVAENITDVNVAQFAKDAAAYLTGDPAGSDDDDNGAYAIEGLAAGYYLIKDKDASLAGDDDAYTSYILEVTANETINVKTGTVQSFKKVDDENDSVVDVKEEDKLTTDGEDEVEWEDSADYDIGDNVPFQLKGILPANFTSYNKYYLAFHDVESAGLTFDPSSVKVYIDGVLITEGYTVKTDNLEDGCTFEVIFQDVRSIANATNNSKITIEYESKLNEKAVLGSAGNPNTMYMEYSNNPNQEWNGEGKPETGKTPEDKVIVFTYKVKVNKVNENDEPLSGAEFRLEKLQEDGSWKELILAVSDEGTTFTFEGLDDGKYKLTETKAPAGYNLLTESIEFTVTADHQIESDNPALLSLTGGDKFTGEVDGDNKLTGTLSADVVNNAGTTLPETGGIGTTIFYVVGGVLLVGAVVLLITKKRMGAEG